MFTAIKREHTTLAELTTKNILLRLIKFGFNYSCTAIDLDITRGTIRNLVGKKETAIVLSKQLGLLE